MGTTIRAATIRRKPKAEAAPPAGAPTAEPAPGPVEPPAAVAPPRPLRVLFIHPAYPNQFTAIGATLNQMAGFECSALVRQGQGASLAAEPPGMPHSEFTPDGAATPQSYAPAQAFENGMRNGHGIAQAVLALQSQRPFDAIVGHAAFGSTLHLRPLCDSAIISYCELPGYQSATARREFPLTVDLLLSSHAYQALLHTSLLGSDLGVAPSAYVKHLLPPELQGKMRVQMEGFDAAHLPPGGPAERAALGLPPNAPLVGFFGRTLEAVRGFDIFVETAKRLRAHNPAIQFLVIGNEQSIYGHEAMYLGGASFKQFALARAGLPEQFFIWRPMLPYAEFRRYLACLDLAILPYFDGAANWSLFEAMAAGLPILSSTRGFVPEAIRHGQHGLLLDPYDVDGYVWLALKVLQNKEMAARLGQAAQQRIQQDFSHQRAAEGYAQIIREAVQSRANDQSAAPLAPADASAGAAQPS